MTQDITVKLHDVATDGLPCMDNPDMIGRVAFIWDGAVVSGWPIGDGQRWEPSEDSFGGPVSGVKQWLEFPAPTWRL